MKRMLSFFLMVASSMTLSNCKEGESKITPSNLQVQTTVSSDGSGLVTFTAQAENATRYEFYFGESQSDVAFKTATGTAEHTYTSANTYTATVAAYSIDELFIFKRIVITIEGEEPPTGDGYTTPTSYPNMTLVWQDEFDGNALNLNDWTHEIGNGSNGWGNNELEYYQAANTSVKDGYLTIEAKKEDFGIFHYTSSRMITKGKKEFKYGRVDIRAKLPKGQGIWPALWMLGSNISTVGWPKCGEVDIMEMIGGGPGRDNKLYGTAHWDNAGSYASYGGNKTLADGKTFADEFHVFSIVWTATNITWYLNDVQYHVIDITPAELSEFQKDAFFIFNVAVGGNWPGSPDASTVFPQRMVVDYIRVFQ